MATQKRPATRKPQPELVDDVELELEVIGPGGNVTETVTLTAGEAVRLTYPTVRLPAYPTVRLPAYPTVRLPAPDKGEG
jgi:hypothetical protein